MFVVLKVLGRWREQTPWFDVRRRVRTMFHARYQTHGQQTAFRKTAAWWIQLPL